MYRYWSTYFQFLYVVEDFFQLQQHLVMSLQVLDERFSPPLGFSISDYLAHSWVVWSSSGKPVDVELVFSREVADRVGETRWHPSQELERLVDGRVLMRLRVASTLEIKHWVLGWGADCEVLAPAAFRAEISRDAQQLAAVYTSPAMATIRDVLADASRGNVTSDAQRKVG